MTLEAHAKINLTLEVLGCRVDGYHDLRSVVVPIPLHDDIDLAPAEGISVMGCPQISLERNLAYKAAVLLQQVSGRTDGVAISLVKRIPSGAGLGGGSADAAAVLNGLNEMWKLGIPRMDLAALGAQIGSDIPALVLGGPVLMEGRGERVSALPPETMPDFSRLVLRVPPIFCSTPEVFRAYRSEDHGLCRNDLQPAACRLHPGIVRALADLEAEGCQGVQMSGSGSAVFGWQPVRSTTGHPLGRHEAYAISGYGRGSSSSTSPKPRGP